MFIDKIRVHNHKESRTAIGGRTVKRRLTISGIRHRQRASTARRTRRRLGEALLLYIDSVPERQKAIKRTGTRCQVPGIPSV